MHPHLKVVDHPLVARLLTVLRDRSTTTGLFSHTLSDVSMLLVYEALRDLPTAEASVPTPLEQATARRLASEIVVVAILRAGLGMVDGALRVIPEAHVGHLGMARDERLLRPVSYYESLPPGLPEAEVLVADPMLATGGSAIAALMRVRAAGARSMRFVCLVAAPEGVRALADAFPDVPVTCAAVDNHLDEHGYIRPGLGDAGDRLYGR